MVVGTLLNSLLRHGDRVTIACQAQLVNVIGLLRSEPGGDAWKQTTAYPFEQMRRLARGQIIQVVAQSDCYDSPSYTDVPLVDASATYDAGVRTGGPVRRPSRADRDRHLHRGRARHRRTTRGRCDDPARDWIARTAMSPTGTSTTL